MESSKRFFFRGSGGLLEGLAWQQFLVQKKILLALEVKDYTTEE